MENSLLNWDEMSNLELIALVMRLLRYIVKTRGTISIIKIIREISDCRLKDGKYMADHFREKVAVEDILQHMKEVFPDTNESGQENRKEILTDLYRTRLEN